MKTEGSGARTRCRREHGDKPEHLKLLEEWMKSYRPGRTVRRGRAR